MPNGLVTPAVHGLRDPRVRTIHTTCLTLEPGLPTCSDDLFARPARRRLDAMAEDMGVEDVRQPAERPLISVVIPVRNGMPWLEYQLRALAAQQIEFDWEVVVADNGSDDETVLAYCDGPSGVLAFISWMLQRVRGRVQLAISGSGWPMAAFWPSVTPMMWSGQVGLLPYRQPWPMPISSPECSTSVPWTASHNPFPSRLRRGSWGSSLSPWEPISAYAERPLRPCRVSQRTSRQERMSTCAGGSNLRDIGSL